jgi:S-adenosylmethionine synthetase
MEENCMSIKTSEFCSPRHPDKICDFIADSILDAYLAGDPESRVAVEVMGGHNLITINGEVTSKLNLSQADIEKLVQDIVAKEDRDYKIISNIVAQSSEIAQGVDTGGAGDQGIMKGYATSETPEYLPLEYILARDLCKKIYDIYPYDGKTQVTIEKDPSTPLGASKVKTVVASFQNTKNEELLKLVQEIMKAEDLPAEALAEAGYLINPAGEWTQGGFDSDTGLSGRKLVIDNYGPEIPIGGGSFSGKDYTKVDRSGAYMARRIAVEILENKKSAGENISEVFVKLAYAIGKSEPVMAVAVIDGVEEQITNYDLSPKGIREYLKLDQVKFAETAQWGHFSRGFEWK